MAKHPKNEPELENDNEVIEEAAEPVEETETAVEVLPTVEEQLAVEKERYLRLAAEYDNFRKRSQREREQLFAMVRGDTILQFLPVYDNLERALGQPTEDEAYKKGIELTMTQLLDIFQNLGVTRIDALGEKFDANLHNAVMHVDDDEHGEGEIVEEFQRGFKLGDKVIRFSMVKVAN